MRQFLSPRLKEAGRKLGKWGVATLLSLAGPLASQAQNSVLNIIEDSPVHTTLEDAVIAAELDGALNDPSAELTVFAPTDAAFEALGQETIDALLAEPKGDLTDILLYHVVGMEAFSGDLSDGQKVETLNGKSVTISISNEVMVNNAIVTVKDIDADNGVVHVIDAVLLPPVITVFDVIEESEDHMTLEAAILAAELDGALEDESSELTVFAPTDAAFEVLGEETINALLAEPKGDLTDILLYHVVGAKALSGSLSDGQEIATLNGKEVTISTSAGVMVNDAMVTVADLETDNGVVHVIDAVLLPPVITVFDVIEESENHMTLEAAILAAELDGALDDESSEFTVFAPTDAAFEVLGQETIDALLADPKGDLTDILLYHVVGAKALSGSLSDGQEIATLNGKEVTISTSAGVMVNDAMVTVADLETDNGVVHVIDAVLLPPVITVFDVIEESEDHMTLEAAILAAELDGALEDESSELTVFAPTDAAFEVLGEETINALLADPKGDLTDILLYHVVGMEAFSGNLSDGQKVETLNGKSVMISTSGQLMVNNANIIVTDIDVDNGIVHVIDAVLLPPVVTVFDVIEESEDHTTLEAAILAAELDGALEDESSELTVFAPTDAAFEVLGQETIDALLADPKGDLTDILLYHVVGAKALSSSLFEGQEIETLNGQNVTVSLQGGVMINDAMVVVADLESDNGVVHVIDAVLMPEMDPLSTESAVETASDLFYPNPAEGDFVNTNKEAQSYEIYDASGTLQLSGKTGQQGIFVGELEAGIYIIRLTNSDQVMVGRLIKN